jgi:MYXO-CTERM domain-containing protein
MRSTMSLLAGAVLLCATPMVARAESAPAPYVSISSVSIVEGDSGMTPFSVTLSLSNYYYSATTPVIAKVTATPGTASEKDYVFTTTQVTFGGDAGVQTVSGFILGDIEPEGDETFTLTATPVAPDGGYAPYFYSSGGMITIKDDDQARASRLHAEGVTILEGDNGAKQAELRVSLEPASTSDVKVKYQSQDGTATAKVDYVPVSGTLSFAPGEVFKTIVVDIIGDGQAEADETFSVVLSDPSMALLGTPRAEVVIVNDDVLSTPDPPPPVPAVEPQPDGGVAVGKLDAGDDAKFVDPVPYGFDARPVNESDARTAGNDSGGGGNGTAFGGGCSCSVSTTGHASASMLLLLGSVLAGWLRRRRR